MTREQFRAELLRLGLPLVGLARLLRLLGDDGSELSVRRRIEAWASGRSKVPGEIVALLTVLRRFPAVLAQLRDELGQDAEAGGPTSQSGTV